MSLQIRSVRLGLVVGLFVLKSSWLIGQEANPNARLRKSGQPSGSLRRDEEKPQAGNSVSASASASASGFGFGQGGGFGAGNGMGFGQGYGNGMPMNRRMGFGNGMGFGTANARASVTVNGGEMKSARPSSGANRSQAEGKATSSSKKNRSASYVDGDRMISVTESKSKIKVTISNEATDEEKSYSAKNAAELEKKFPEAYEAYKLATQNNEDEQGADAEDAAENLMKEQFKKMEAESNGNPAMQQMLQQMRRELGR